MAFTQNNPFGRKTSSPLNNISGLRNFDLAKSVKKAVDYVNQNDRIDPTFNPEYRNRYEVVNENMESGDDIRGYEGITDRRGGGVVGIYRPTGAIADSYRTGDVYANDRDMQRHMSFDPESGYSARPLNITYDKREDGTPYSAYIDPNSAGNLRNTGSKIDDRFGKSSGKSYNLKNTKEKAEFEKARLRMYQNQMDMVNDANAMYKVADPEKYLNYFQNDQRTGESRNTGW